MYGIDDLGGAQMTFGVVQHIPDQLSRAGDAVVTSSQRGLKSHGRTLGVRGGGRGMPSELALNFIANGLQ